MLDDNRRPMGEATIDVSVPIYLHGRSLHVAYSQQLPTDTKTTSYGGRTSGQDLRGSGSDKRQKENLQSVNASSRPIQHKSNKSRKGIKNAKKTDRSIYDICQNHAPYFAYQIEGKKWGVVQGCCNDWTCPRCGQQRAREEYGRIIEGARQIGAALPLYFLTITCRGKECSLSEAENNYLDWTNRFLTRIRVSSKRGGKQWHYASVTERQERLHPHSHFITTYCPADAIPIAKGEGKYFYTSGDIFPAKHDTLQSRSLEIACVGSGLGVQYDLSRVVSVEAGSRYVSKYLFKPSIFETVWPRKWRRVRYSQNWPKLPTVKTDALLLLTAEDWQVLAKKALIVVTKDDGVKAQCEWALSRADVIIQ